jgi:cob(I)alamin adenosyltransferase
VCRRAERLATELAEIAPVNPEAVRYLNRLSDLMFVAARYLNKKGAGDILWRPGANR